MKALIDGDIVGFRTAAASEEADLEICLLRLDKFVRDILYNTGADTYEIYLTGSDNFRKQIFPEYKAHRKDKVPPKWLQQCREYLVTEWKARISEGCEADDLLGCNQQQEGTIICSIDKDLLQIPGTHYNFIKNEWISVSELGGLKHFYTQLLMGDKADGIPGLQGIGEKKAFRMLEGCETEQEMFNTCVQAYENNPMFDIYGKCLWIWRKENDIWDYSHLLTGENQLNSEAEEPSGSTTPKEEEISLSLDLITPDKDGYLVHGH